MKKQKSLLEKLVKNLFFFCGEKKWCKDRHKLARKGEQVNLEKRKITIEILKLLK